MAKTTYSDETKAAVIEALREGEDIKAVAKRFDIPLKTAMGWWRWQEKYELSARHREFVNVWFRNGMNATRAYMEAYSTDNYGAAAVSAHHLLKNPKVQSVIQDRMKRRAMEVEEVLMRLGDMARGDMTQYLEPDGTLDIEALREDGLGHLLKKHKVRRVITTYKDGSESEAESREHEFYDAQAALVHIGRHHRLFSDAATGREDDPIHHVHKGYVNVSPDDWDADEESD